MAVFYIPHYSKMPEAIKWYCMMQMCHSRASEPIPKKPAHFMQTSSFQLWQWLGAGTA